MKNTNSIYREAFKVCALVLLLGVVEFILFTVFMNFRIDILLGVLYGCVFVCLNFLFLTHSVKKAAEKGEGGAKAYMSSTYTVRMLLTAGMIILAAKVDYIYIWAAIIPLFFQRIAATVVPFINKRSDKS